MQLEKIGFYTLSEARCKQASSASPLSRCELILTSRCNFKCPYCRSVGGADMTFEEACYIVNLWTTQGLKNIRFSGGEPTIWPDLVKLIEYTKAKGIERIAISTNGSASLELYTKLASSGVSDFSISLDACCAEVGDRLAGGIKGSWEQVCKAIKHISQLSYTTVGIVLTKENRTSMKDIVTLADSLGVSDIRVIPVAQEGEKLKKIKLPQELLTKYPILAYRVENVNSEIPVRGLQESDSTRCGLCLDDMAVNHDKHYPCIIYMREGGNPIGQVGTNMRDERQRWYTEHNTHLDPICKGNCLDVCVQYNNSYAAYHS